MNIIGLDWIITINSFHNDKIYVLSFAFHFEENIKRKNLSKDKYYSAIYK